MKNLEHTIRDVVSNNHIVEQELIEANAIIEDFQKEFLLMIIEEYDEISEEEYNIITEEFLQNLDEEDYSGLKSLIPGYDVYKSLKKGKYGDAARDALIDIGTTALALTGVGAPAAAAIRGAKVASKLSKIRALSAAGKKLPKSPKMSFAKRFVKNIKPAAKATAVGVPAVAALDVGSPGTVTDKPKKPVPPINFKEPQKFDPSNVTFGGTLGKKGLEDMKRRREERERHGSPTPNKSEKPKSTSFKYQNQDFKKDKKGKWVPAEQPKIAEPAPTPKQTNVAAPPSAPEQPKQTKVAAPPSAPEQPKTERWADVRKRLGYSRRQSVTSDPKLLAAYNAYKEKQSLAAETEYKGELIENPIANVLSETSKRGLGSIQKILSRLKNTKSSKATKGALAKRLMTRAGLSKAAIGIGSIILNRLLQGGSGYSKSDGSSLTTKSSPTQLHIAKNISEGYTLPEAVEPSKKARKDVEVVPRKKYKNRKALEYVAKKDKGAITRQASIKSLDM